jgi:3-hydroxybutyryl-CoA dehydratase
MITQSFYVEVGQEVRFSKTISESDVYLFAGITGDLSSNHVNHEVMSKSKYKQRVVHGALLVGFMSTTSTRMIETYGKPPGSNATAVSLGYDRVRFLSGVYFGDTITVCYRINQIEPERGRSRAQVTVTNQHGAEVAVAEHILKWVPNDS